VLAGLFPRLGAVRKMMYSIEFLSVGPEVGASEAHTFSGVVVDL
jgi:hypothetical protein